MLELFAREVCKFLKKQANFQHILLFPNVCKQAFHISHVRISQKLKGEIFKILFSYEDEDIGRFSYLHQSTFKEITRLIRIGISNIHLKVTIEKN